MTSNQKQYETMAVLRAYAAEIAAEPSRDVRPSHAKSSYADVIARMAEIAKQLETQS